MTSGVHGNRGYVLVADDNVAVRTQISSILEESGFAVIQAENGQAASSALQGHAFDAALLDVGMPDLDGPDIAPIARQVGVPVIGLSPANRGADRWAAAGVVHVVEKPVDRALLLTTLNEVLLGQIDGPPVDLDHLAQYTAGDKSIERELAGLFATSSARYLDTMKTQGRGRDWQIAAHSLKGSAKGIGAGRVAQLAEKAENPVEETADDNRQEILRELQEAIAEVDRYFSAYLSD